MTQTVSTEPASIPFAQEVPTLARTGLDRAAEHRVDASWLASAWSDPATRVLVIAEGRALATDLPAASEDDRAAGGGGAAADAATTRLLLISPGQAPEQGDRYFLGVDGEGTAYFAVAVAELPGLPDPAAAPAVQPAPAVDRAPDGSAAPAVRTVGLREAGGLLSDLDAGLMVHAVGLENWHRANGFCPFCGSGTVPVSAGHVRRCTGCGREQYPRTDPAVIMLITDDQDRALLGRGSTWPPGRYSALAGFVEPGESLEHAVAREVSEESGVRVVPESVRYRGSQPWPFPSSLMLGFFGRADATGDGSAIRVDTEELSDARWVSREELRTGMANGTLLPPPGISIARLLIEQWYGGPLPAAAW